MRGKFWRNFFIVLFIVGIFTLIGLTNGDARNTTALETIIGNIFTLPQRGFTYFQKWVQNDATFFKDIDNLKSENERLSSENTKLNQKLLDYELLVSENNVLKEHAKVIESYPDYNIVAAEVISDSLSNWEEVYVINRGSSDGITPNMAVITTDGLVGYVSEVSKNSSKVISILDAGNSVSARLVKTRDAVVCRGNVSLKEKSQLKVIYIPIGIELVAGDKIETSGMGGIYPKGIVIGTVESFETKKNPSENEAVLEPSVDFNRLETVGVIISTVVQENL